jgi:hypothetical protein
VLEAYLKEEGSLASALTGAASASPTQFIQPATDANGALSGAQKSSGETSCRSLAYVFWEAVTGCGKLDPPQAASKPSESKLPEIGLVHFKFCKIGIVLSSFGREIHLLHGRLDEIVNGDVATFQNWII